MDPAMSSEPIAQKEMPRYQSHKKVWALQIAAISRRDTKIILQFADSEYAPLPVPYEVVSRYWPKPGDYYLLYEDGYQSISPRKAFEEGYTKL
jgi:hypothetical protein